jgi:flavin reductase (DIM6/NTAB) family NADH-FMN oxidoreductase RutF
MTARRTVSAGYHAAMAAPGPPDPLPVGPPEEGTPTAGRLRRLRTRYPSGVVVVACQVPEGLRGVTVSSFAAVSLEPPLVLFCLDRELESEGLLREAGGFGISVLSDRQELLSQRFAAAAPLVDDAFTGAPYFVRESGAPLLEDAVAWFDCRPHATYEGGDHTIFVGRVVWAAENPRQPMPLVTFSRFYAGLSNMRPP